MIEIIPAILPESFSEIEVKAGLVAGLVKTIQIDVVDGKFAPHKTWPYNGKGADRYQAIIREEEGLPHWEKLNVEIDAMVADPTIAYNDYIRLGATRVVLHIESLPEEAWLNFFLGLDSYLKDHIEIGIAINTTTPINTLAPILMHAAFVQCMGIERVGFQGQPFDSRVFAQIEAVKSLAPKLPISIDGGVNLETAPELVRAGATRLVIGSALFGTDDIRGTLEAFKHVCRVEQQ